MTREDIIKDVASKFATHSINTGVTDCYGQLIIERGLNNDEERGFWAGAQWVDKYPKEGLIDLSQAWHNSKEEPEKGSQ